jgi:tRNA(Ile)-lysidine synthase TilS/MesJ
MNSVGAETIAFGHHADDQVETFLMRIAKGTSTLGLGGMKAVRRFGMGGVVDGKMGWFGHLGMKRWIVRPLLSVSKVTVGQNGLGLQRLTLLIFHRIESLLHARQTSWNM